MNILVTAGPTREFLDDVRFLSNRSTGKMGYAVAREAAGAGHVVRLVSGPVSLTCPKGVERIDVTSAEQMLGAVTEQVPWCDALVMTAAVADYRPAIRLEGKLKKADEKRVLELVPNPDILLEVSRMPGHRIVVGFALEAVQLEAGARAKLARKKLDYVVANGPASLGADRTDVVIYGRDGCEVSMTGATKRRVARAIIELIERAGS